MMTIRGNVIELCSYCEHLIIWTIEEMDLDCTVTLSTEYCMNNRTNLMELSSHSEHSG